MSHLLEGKLLAIIIPVYNEGSAVADNFREIDRIISSQKIECRYLFVDDGSKDDTWAELTKLSEAFDCVSAIRFARNFGKEIALCAGLDHMDADYYITMDSDLQHPPKYISDMLQVMEKEKANVVAGIKSDRGKEGLFHKLFAKGFYKFLKFIAKIDLDNSSDFKLMDRQVVDTIRGFNERNVFFRGLVNWVGFKSIKMPFEVEERKIGTTHFSTTALILTALNAILAYTSKPLYITVFSGLIFLFFAVVLGVQTLANYFMGIAVSGFSTVILLLLITGSMMMLSLGMIGIYISRIYDEIKGRPRYVISDKVTK